MKREWLPQEVDFLTTVVRYARRMQALDYLYNELRKHFGSRH